MKPEIREAGDEFFYTWPDYGIGLCFNRLRETDAGLLKGYLTVESTVPGNAGHIYWSYVTLSTGVDRDRVVKKIQKVVPAEGWEAQIDRCFQDVALRFLRVPDPVSLRDVPLEEEAGYLFEPVAPLHQVTELLADQGSSKSYLLNYLAVATAANVPTIFGHPTLPGPVVYYDWETDGSTQRRRMEWVCRGLGLSEPPADFYYLNMQDKGRLMDRIREMRSQVARLGAVLVMVDSLTFATGGDLNSTELSGPTMTAIGSLGERVTKIVAAHHAKAGREAKNGSRPSVIGSGLFEFKARSIWVLQRESEGGASFNVGMAYAKLSDGPSQRPLAYRIAFDNERRLVTFGGYRVEDSPELSEKTLSVPARIRLLLRLGKADTTQIARRLGIDPADAGRNLRRMSDVVLLSEGGGRGKAAVWGLGESPNGNADTRTPLSNGVCPPLADGQTKTDITRTKADMSAFSRGEEEDDLAELPF